MFGGEGHATRAWFFAGFSREACWRPRCGTRIGPRSSGTGSRRETWSPALGRRLWCCRHENEMRTRVRDDGTARFKPDHARSRVAHNSSAVLHSLFAPSSQGCSRFGTEKIKTSAHHEATFHEFLKFSSRISCRACRFRHKQDVRSKKIIA